jgi:hypothetical protein
LELAPYAKQLSLVPVPVPLARPEQLGRRAQRFLHCQKNPSLMPCPTC